MKLTTSIVAIGFALAGALSAAPAQAQNRAFVSAGGSDSNACSFVAPCRSLQHAHDTVTANGEIDVLDPAGYGTLMINRAISINGHGYAEILVGSGGTGITINTSTGAINLSGLIIDGQGAGQTGIQVGSGAAVTISNCVIRNMAQDGIDFFSTTSSSDPNINSSSLTVSNSLVADNGGRGIRFLPQPTGSFPSSQATAAFYHVEVSNNGDNGIEVDGTNASNALAIRAAASESIATGNGQSGFFATTSSTRSSLMVSHSVAANNYTGVHAINGATIFLANSTVTGNVIGWDTPLGGVLDSYGDNYIDGNTSNEMAPTKIPPK